MWAITFWKSARGQAPPPRNCENAPVASSVLSTTIFLPLNLHEGTTMPTSCKPMRHPCPLPTELSPRQLRYLSCIICSRANNRIVPSQKFIGYCDRAPTFLLLKFQTDGSIASFTSTARSSQSRPMHLRLDWPPRDSSISLSIAEQADLAFARPAKLTHNCHLDRCLARRGERANFAARLHHAQNRIARNHPYDVRSSIFPVAHFRHF